MMSSPLVKKLKNGLRVISSPIKEAQSVTVLVVIGAGTKYENLDNNGISHFLEHLVFKGTKNFPATIDIPLAVEGVGGVYNAFTGKEYTGFYVKTTPDHLDLAMKVVSDLVFNPLFPEKELEMEKNVIIEEMRMYRDDPKSVVGHLFENMLFPESTLGWETLGTEENINRMTPKNIQQYWQLMYVPNRMVLSISGALPEKKVLEEKIDQYFQKDSVEVTLPALDFALQQTKPCTKIVAKDIEQAHIAYGFRTFGRSQKEKYTLSVLATVLGQGMSSRLFTQIREVRGLAYYIHSGAHCYVESGYIAMRAGSNPKLAGEVVGLTREEFLKFTVELVPEHELIKAKEFIKGNFLLGLEDNYELAEFYAEDLLLDDKIRSVDEVLEKLFEVTSADIQKLAQKLFVPERENLAIVGPKTGLNIDGLDKLGL